MAARLAIGLVLGTGLVLLAIKGRLLTCAGALAAFVLLLDILLLGGYAPAVYIVTIFLLSGLVGKLASPKKKTDKHPPRGVRQVAANGAVAGVCLLLYGLFGSIAFLVAYYAAVAEFFTDTLASDVGVHAKGRPFDIAKWRRTERGRSGGVSALGTAASAAGALACLLFTLGAGLSLPYALIAATAAFLGMLIDSILGSLLQAKYTCRICGAYTERPMHCGEAAVKAGGIAWINNSTVNLLSNALAAVIAALCTLFM